MRKLICTKLFICFALNILMVPAIHANNQYLKHKKRKKQSKIIKKQKLQAKLEKKRKVARHLRNKKRGEQRKISEQLKSEKNRPKSTLSKILKKISYTKLPNVKTLAFVQLIKKAFTAYCYGECKGDTCCTWKWSNIVDGMIEICKPNDYCKEAAIKFASENIQLFGNSIDLRCFPDSTGNLQCVELDTKESFKEIISQFIGPHVYQNIISTINSVEGILIISVGLAFIYFTVKNYNTMQEIKKLATLSKEENSHKDNKSSVAKSDNDHSTASTTESDTTTSAVSEGDY